MALRHLIGVGHLACVATLSGMAACSYVIPTYVDDDGESGAGADGSPGGAGAGAGAGSCELSSCPSAPGAVAVCDGSACGLECEADRGDCNGDLVTEGGDGCEVDLLADDTNCGECDNACALGCVEGGCNVPVELSMGWHSSCARLTDGSVWCWGQNEFGEVGDGTTTPVHAAKRVPLASTAKAITTGGDYTTALSCAIMSDDTATCWGSTAYDGNPTAGGPTPTAVMGIANVAKIAIGGGHACAIKNDGVLLCWGDNENGELGTGTAPQDESLPTQIMTGIADVSAGGNHTCAVETDGDLFCWGASQFDVLGIPASGDLASPGEVALDDVLSVSVGTMNSCALKANEVYCWGWDYNAGVGTNQCTGQVPSPILIAVGNPVAIFADGREEGAAVAGSDRHLVMWGIGPHPFEQTAFCGVNNHPAMVDLVTLAQGDYSTCALIAGGTLLCWGDDTFGTVGDGLDAIIDKEMPTPVVFEP